MIQIYTTMADSYSNSEPYYRIENIIYHPDFIKFMTSIYLKESDICVVKVIETMIFSSYLNKIDLPSTDITEGSIGVITGWGTTKFSAEFYPEQLQTITMTVYDGWHCVFDSPLFLDYGQFCAVNQRGVGLCYGDSGNPFVYNNTLAGIASLILPCATGEPDVFTRVYYHMDFIKEAMKT
ncbi:PREDICTED: chymotrypsin-1-like [Ceratosolen solmsi marchali]|uniref:Chymotrypsin-1-like n=1 Tax=Ceratosolen solmsi marchali TaxID=326594 RepID=A0AAJ7DZM9_9HYME|nr:PREDICTED: chymotrypsin-1-like [Ceratosolen solmsi marchali]